MHTIGKPFIKETKKSSGPCAGAVCTKPVPFAVVTCVPLTNLQIRSL